VGGVIIEVDQGDLRAGSGVEYNDRPIIGILSQELDDWIEANLPMITITPPTLHLVT